jgi:uncharacterized membrane protein
VIPVLESSIQPLSRAARVLRVSAALLVAASWISAGAFGLYILAFYLLAVPAGRIAQWNENLSGLFTPRHPLSVLAISAHFATGAILLLLGPVQLIAAVRRRWPRVHRWLGRLYVFAAALAGAGGLAFIVSRGTIGGPVMDVGFGLYGVLILLAAWQTYRLARAGRFDAHRAWSLRLFALVIGSWLYRMDYGLWLTAAHGLWHRPDFHGGFDRVMSFFFYLPNLALTELFLRTQPLRAHPAFRLFTAALLNLATLIVAVGTYYFLRYYWGPGIARGFFGS